jgi:hypothetical protein
MNHELVDLSLVEKRRNDTSATYHPDVFPLFSRRRIANALIDAFTNSKPDGAADCSTLLVKT